LDNLEKGSRILEARKTKILDINNYKFFFINIIMENVRNFIPQNIPLPIVGVLNKEEQEIFHEARVKAKEEFGEKSKAYQSIIQGIDFEKITGSQFFFNNYLNNFLPKEKRVITLNDIQTMQDYFEDSYFGDAFYDTTDLILRSVTPIYSKNKYVLEYLVKQINNEKILFSKEEPLIISKLELIQDQNPKNKYGILLRLGEDTTFKNDSRFAYSSPDEQKFGKNLILFSKEEEGISRIGANGDRIIDSQTSNLIQSDKDSRISIIDKVLYSRELAEYLTIIEKEKQIKLDQAQRELNDIQKTKRNLAK